MEKNSIVQSIDMIKKGYIVKNLEQRTMANLKGGIAIMLVLFYMENNYELL